MKKRIICFLLAMILVLGLVPNAAVTANAASTRATSMDAIEVLTEIQGFEKYEYKNGGKTYIGYGSEIKSGTYPNGISKEDALELVLDQVRGTVDAAINAFTKKNNVDLTQYEHDALALFSYRTENTSWLSNSSSALYQAVRTGKAGNEFINTIAHEGAYNVADDEGLEAKMNQRLSEANMYLNNGYGYNAPESLGYTVLEDEGDGVVDSGDDFVAYNVNTGYSLPKLSDSNFMGWYFQAEPITKLDEDTAGNTVYARFDKVIASGNAVMYANADELEVYSSINGKVAYELEEDDELIIGKLNVLEVKFVFDEDDDCEVWVEIEGTVTEKDEDGNVVRKYTVNGWVEAEDVELKGLNGNYTVNTSSLDSRNIFDRTFDRAEMAKYKASMDEEAFDTLKSNSNFTVHMETILDGVKWGFGTGKNTGNHTVHGWVYLGEVADAEKPSTAPIATATVTAAKLNIRAGATARSEDIGDLMKGITVDIYEIKVEKTDSGNQSWGKVSVNGVTGWINLAYVDLKETSGETDSAVGEAGKIVNAASVNVRKGAGIGYAKITTLSKGTEVVVLETKLNGAAQWGKVRWEGLKDGYTEGWVYMYYVELDDAPHSNPGNSTGNVIYTGVVTSNINLNVRDEADIYGTKVGSLPNGTKINIYEVKESKNMKWGRIGDDQWVCLTYVNLTEVAPSNPGSGTSTTTEIKATVTSAVLDVLKNYNSNAEKVGSLKKGDVVTILEKNTESTGTGSRIWGRISTKEVSGWINLAYVDLKTVTSVNGSSSSESGSNSGTSNSNGAVATISNCISVNVREGAGVNNAQVTRLNSGTVVNVYEQVTKDNAPWARIKWNNGANEGWVCMYYVTINESASSSGTTEGGLVNGTNSNTISATGYVNSNIALNVRAGAGLSYAKVGSLNKGTKVTIYEQVTADGMIWGRMNYNGGSAWVCMSYINVESASSTGKGVMGTIARCFAAVNVRSAPGTNNALIGKINVGTRVEVFETKTYSNQLWGRVAQGWICMDYVLLDSELPEGEILDATVPTTEATQPTVPEVTINKDNEVAYKITGTVTGDPLNVRNDADADSMKVGTVNKGQNLTILAVKNNGAALWGRIDEYATAGWVNMDYVSYSVHGYVNTDDQAVYANTDTSSTVKSTLVLNEELTITKLSVGGETVYGWVDAADGWIPMGRISAEKVEVIPTYKQYTHDFASGNVTVGTTNTASDVVSEINGSKVVFKLQSGVKVPVGEIRIESGIVWGKLIAHDVTGWINMAKVNYTLSGSAAEDMNVRNEKNTSSDESILGTVAGTVTLCELSFDSYGNLWGKVTGNADAAVNGGYVMVRTSNGTVYISGTGISF